MTQKNSGNDRNKIEVSVEIPVPARFRACDWKEFLRNFEPRKATSDGSATATHWLIALSVGTGVCGHLVGCRHQSAIDW